MLSLAKQKKLAMMFILISLLEVVIPLTIRNVVSTSTVCSSTCSPIARLSCDITSSIISNVAWLFSPSVEEKSDWDVCGVLLPLWYGLTVTARTVFAATSLAFSAFTCGFSYIYTSWSYISSSINWYRCYVYRWLNWIIGSWPQHSFNKKQKTILTGHFSSWRRRNFLPFLENFWGQYLHLMFILRVSGS